MRTLRTPEARSAALFIDSQPEAVRLYLLEMIYRVAGVEPPTPPKTTQRPPSSGNVISIVSARAV
jgi:hypothetical protein